MKRTHRSIRYQLNSPPINSAQEASTPSVSKPNIHPIQPAAEPSHPPFLPPLHHPLLHLPPATPARPLLQRLLLTNPPPPLHLPTHLLHHLRAPPPHPPPQPHRTPHTPLQPRAIPLLSYIPDDAALRIPLPVLVPHSRGLSAHGRVAVHERVDGAAHGPDVRGAVLER